MPSVHFRFKSMKDAQRVTFDGTDISVWELKREIMTIMKLGDGKDFDLALYKDNTDEGMHLETVLDLSKTMLTRY
jgi:protein MPE1